MSWKDKLDNAKFTITTGDGKVYTPLWINGEKSKEFNVSIYDFIDVEASKVDRKQPKSNKYPLVFYFQGDDNIELADAFEASANDSRAWEVNHPFYGLISGQPTSLSRNDNSYNVTQLTVDFWESVSDDYPKSEVSISDRVALKSSNVINQAGISYLSGAKPTTSDISKIKDLNNQTQSSFTKLLDDETKVDYQNAYATSLKALDNLISNTNDAIITSQNLLNIPSTFSKPSLDRVKSFSTAYDGLKSIETDLSGKFFFETQGSTCIANACNASINPISTDYITRDEVQEVSIILLKIYKDYLNELDNNQVDQYDIENAWSPDSNLQILLYDLIAETLSSLFNLAFNSKQERIFYTEKDTNLFLMTHRFLGLDEDDENLEVFRKINNIKNDELFKIPKGRKLKYFV